jgi:hypothetical protein
MSAHRFPSFANPDPSNLRCRQDKIQALSFQARQYTAFAKDRAIPVSAYFAPSDPGHGNETSSREMDVFENLSLTLNVDEYTTTYGRVEGIAMASTKNQITENITVITTYNRLDK